MAEFDNLPHLLGQLAKMRQDAKNNLPADHLFNVFQVLRPEHDEVHLHSRFIGELLNPEGRHGMKTVFLQSFAEQCGFDKHTSPVVLDFDKARVRREYQNIDLLIHDETHFVVIENKIFAADQDKQLQRYAEIILAENKQPNLENGGRPTLYYLTLDGRNATDKSLGKLLKLPLEFVQNISYKDDIIPWLDDCIARSVNLPGLRETLIHYQKLVQKLTGTASTEMEIQLVNLLENNLNGAQAAFIGNNWSAIKRHVEFQFWTELAKLINEKYPITTNQKLHGKTAQTFNLNRKDTYDGIRATIGYISGEAVQLKINRGGGQLNYGLPRLKYAQAGPNGDAPNKARQILDAGFGKSNETDFWLVEITSKSKINFEAFANWETTQLINKNTRQAAVAALWKEVNEWAEKTKAELPGSFEPHKA